MPRKKKVVEPVVEEVVVPEPPLADIVIEVMVTTPNREVHGHVVTIANASGCIMKSSINNPDVIFETLREGLNARYGGHIK